MAQDLSPDLLKQITDYYTQNNGGGPVVGPDGNLYYGVSDMGGSSGANGSNLTSIYSASPQLASSNTQNIGAPMPTYDPKTGQVTGSRPYSPDSQFNDLMGVLSVLGVAGGGALLGGGAAGAGTAGAGGDGLATGGFLGEAPWTATGGGALDFGGAAGAAGAAGVGGGGAGTAAGLGGSALGGGGITGLLGSLGSSGLGSLIAPVIGGLLGSKPTTTGTTGTRDIPDWLKPSVFGLLGQTDALRNKLMAPGALQGYDDMRSVGQNLLNQPIAGNATAQFPSLYPRK